MKRVIALVLVFSFVLGLCGCGKSDLSESAQSETDIADVSEPETAQSGENADRSAFESEGKTEAFANGDTVFVPSENNMQFDEMESAIYYNNLLLTYTFFDLSESEAAALATIVNGEVVGRICGAINALQIQVSESSLQELNSMAKKLMTDERVIYAGYEYPLQFEPNATDNNPWSGNGDPPSADRGNESKPGGNDWWAEAIGTYSAWEYADKTSPINVGIIDAGFQTNHPDLNESIHFLQKYSANTEDDHGTHVAGLISADNNEIGIRGVADQAVLYCVDWSSAQDVDYFSTGKYLEITKQLIENDVRVINNSWGYTFCSERGYINEEYGKRVGLSFLLRYLKVHTSGEYDDYVKYMDAESKRTALDCTVMMIELLLNGNDDFIIVQAAGNGYDNRGPGIDTQKTGFYCAIDESVYNLLPQSARDKLLARGISYNSVADRKVIVGAVKNSRDTVGNYYMSNFSNYGKNVDICAPGEDIFSTVTNSDYDTMSGTSMAAPIVSGCLAYLWSLDPNLTAPQVKNILLSNTSCLACGVGDGKAYTYPMVNITLAVESIPGMNEVQINHYEVFNNGLSSWNEAEEYCESLGGHLATITSPEENSHVYRLMRDAGYESAYFGLTDSGEEGTWVWVTGEMAPYMNWHTGEPNQENENEDYAMFYFKFDDGTWNDGDFGGRTVNDGIAFICEWESEEAYYAYLSQIEG